jgi:hypothetical protein
MVTFSAAQFDAVVGVSVPLAWCKTRFTALRDRRQFMLSGYPGQAHGAILQRLTNLGCEITDQSVSEALGYGSVTFKGSPQVIARLALIFPAPATAQSLVITAKLTLGRRQGGRSVLQAVA